jgi:hypothetical protein
MADASYVSPIARQVNMKFYYQNLHKNIKHHQTSLKDWIQNRKKKRATGYGSNEEEVWLYKS